MSGEEIFVRDRKTGTTERMSVDRDGGDPDAVSEHPSVTPDDRYVAFWSVASDLVAGDTYQSPDVFLHDRHTAPPSA